MCTLTSVVRSQHATGQSMRICMPRTSISEYTIRHSGLVGVFIQRMGFVFYRTLYFVCLFVLNVSKAGYSTFLEIHICVTISLVSNYEIPCNFRGK